MKTKYFRFLYHGDKGCFIHAGELEDTATQERFIFIYLSGTKQLAEFFFRAHQLYSCCEPGLERDALFIQMVTKRIVAVLGEGAVLQHCKTARQTVS